MSSCNKHNWAGMQICPECLDGQAEKEIPLCEVARCLGAMVQDLCNKGIVLESGVVTFKDTGKRFSVGELLDRLDDLL